MKISEILNESRQTVPDGLIQVGHRVKWYRSKDDTMMFGTVAKIEHGILSCTDDKFGTHTIYRVNQTEVLEVMADVEGSWMMDTVWKYNE